MDKVKFTYKEEIEISLKAIFLLQILFKLPDKTMNTSSKYDWMHHEYYTEFYGPTDEHKSTNKAWNELRDTELITSVDVGEDCYFQYKISKKAEALKSKILRKNTKMYNNLIPKGFF